DRARDLAVNHVEVGEGCVTARAPVDQALAAVDQLFVVELLEDRADRPRRTGIHREAVARPVAGGPQRGELLANADLILVHPLPDALEEGFAAQVMAREPFPGELSLNHPLTGDASVVGAREPERPAPL